MSKVHNLQANSLELSMKEEDSIVETENGKKLIYSLNTRFVRTIKDVPNKRLKEKKK